MRKRCKVKYTDQESEYKLKCFVKSRKVDGKFGLTSLTPAQILQRKCEMEMSKFVTSLHQTLQKRCEKKYLGNKKDVAVEMT